MEGKVLHFIRRKKRWVFFILLVALLFYFFLPLSLILIPDIMNKPSFLFGLPWAWIYALLQIPMTWFFCGLYNHNAKKYEQELTTIKGERLR